ncbi:MAG: RagB/SusD family nutrient uptake outer membrane protein [Odoribacteraceae bacterium]|jgi:hypothetical protein|nr:RagB/SusD family nutrient uptake outer membrane protein [Odoribacteraceae bacterium]
MKHRIAILLSVLFFGSCSDWLTVEPEDQIDKKKLYADEAGFQIALNGIYQLCAQPSLYGKNLSWGAIDIIAQQYENDPINDYADWYFSQFEYERAEVLARIDAIWSGLYNVIANCNLLINEVSKAPASLFTLDTIAKNVILGEALAVRALCHMDLYRIFTPAPVKGNREIVLPYQASYPSDFSPAYTAQEGMERVVEDLLTAKKLIAYNDTTYHLNQMRYWLNARIMGQYTAAGGTFFNYRGYRLNYCAVVGLLARAYLYKGDMEKAKRCAYEIYSNFHKSKGWFRFHGANDYTTSFANKQKKHLDDCLFAFYNNELLFDVELYLTSSALNVVGVDEIYRNDEDDYRRSLIEQQGTQFTGSLKYRLTGNYQRDNYEGNAIPNMRLTEIYHILIESNFDTNPSESLRLLKELRAAMGCKRDISLISNKSELHELLITDARREFIGEGQLLFYYKRLNKGIKVPGSELEPKESIITLPIPDSQHI